MDFLQFRVSSNSLLDRFDHRRQLTFDFVKDHFQSLHLHPRIEGIDCSIVQGHVRLGQRQDLLSQIEHLLEHRHKRAEVGVLTSFHPGSIARRLQVCFSGRELGAHSSAPLVSRLALSNVRSLKLIEAFLLLLEGGQQFSDCWIYLRFMQNSCKNSFLVRSRSFRSCRHHRLLIPAEQTHCSLKMRDLLQLLTKLLIIIRHGAHVQRVLKPLTMLQVRAESRKTGTKTSS
mmetsp:Transcript_22676/g.51121  ORF Transcript_22676/g.51121 Transcript_22676/m.51121 type:complete len:230 (-) Transcript_22676:185-874(-)